VVLQAIATHALTKRYKGARGIEEVTFSVAPGEVFGFLGPNGGAGAPSWAAGRPAS
jgi:ABC-type multidrug transport system ATPase subunit